MSMDKMEQARWDLAAEMFKRAGDNGGWTLDVHQVAGPKYGYSVGGNPLVPGWIIPSFREMPGPFVIQQIARYLENIDAAGLDWSGGWVDDGGALVLDSPSILVTREAAIRLGHKRGEQAIYCLHTGETITL